MKKTMLALLCWLAWPAAAADLKEIVERGILRVGVYDDAPQLSWREEDGTYTGFDAELSRALAEALLGDPSKVEFVHTLSRDRIPHLKDDKVDVLMLHFTKSPDREKLVSFAEPYRKVQLVMVTRRADAIASMDDLKDKTVIAFHNTGEERFMKKNFPHIQLLSLPSITESYDALQQGRGDAMIGSSAAVWIWLAEHPQFEVRVPFLRKARFVGPVVDNESKDLLQWLNREMDAMRKDGRLQEIYRRVLRPVYGDQVREEDFLVL